MPGTAAIVAPSAILAGGSTGNNVYSILVDAREGGCTGDGSLRAAVPSSRNCNATGRTLQSTMLRSAPVKAVEGTEKADPVTVGAAYASLGTSSLVGDIDRSFEDWILVPGQEIGIPAEDRISIAVESRTGRTPYHRWNGPSSGLMPNLGIRCADSLLPVVSYDDREWFKTSVYTLSVRIILDTPLAVQWSSLEASLFMLRGEDSRAVDSPDGGILFQKPNAFEMRRVSAGDSTIVQFDGEVGPFSPTMFSFVHHSIHKLFKLRLQIRHPATGFGFACDSPNFVIKSKKPKKATEEQPTERVGVSVYRSDDGSSSGSLCNSHGPDLSDNVGPSAAKRSNGPLPTVQRVPMPLDIRVSALHAEVPAYAGAAVDLGL